MPSDFFKRFAHLKELDISKCGLTEMPESPWSTGSRLRALHLNGNRLRTITNSTLAGLKSLEYLNVGDMTSISVFQVQQNEITGFLVNDQCFASGYRMVVYLS